MSIASTFTDIDECADEFSNPCSHTTTHCLNVHGSYTCECNKGYEKKGNKCEGNIFCLNSSFILSLLFFSKAQNKTQYHLQNYELFISDINECKTEIAGCNQICVNADGGYSCGCYRGFTLDDDRSHCNKGLCVDICVSCNIECFYSYTYILLKQ